MYISVENVQQCSHTHGEVISVPLGSGLNGGL